MARRLSSQRDRRRGNIILSREPCHTVSFHSHLQHEVGAVWVGTPSPVLLCDGDHVQGMESMSGDDDHDESDLLRVCQCFLVDFPRSIDWPERWAHLSSRKGWRPSRLSWLVTTISKQRHVRTYLSRKLVCPCSHQPESRVSKMD